MGLIIRVKNDRVFSVNDVVEVDEGKYTIKRIMFSTNPDDTDYVNLIVSKAS